LKAFLETYFKSTHLTLLKWAMKNTDECRIFTNFKLTNAKCAQQSVHPTLGILARFQAVFYASAFSQSDGVPPPDPARVTQTVSLPLAKLSS
jgi:hypothetical protein